MPSKDPVVDPVKDPVIAPNRAELIGLWAATLSIAEVGVGSFMHAFHIPLTGTFLSLNQAAFLTRLTKLNQHRDDARGLAFDVSTVTALIKSFSPIGKRLTPMLAISVQGLLFGCFDRILLAFRLGHPSTRDPCGYHVPIAFID